ncbi:unnamed protein product [Vitrella brassicaformis CCMP3155]|uniref:Uncharacterized protein n=1 Tax=Vitrella brassicaformis (strain CCMP3155) TaxID=1169540 RepID=A0A0G4H602_VITBC|nr:unnamed protein product [Vitrella brassicaformis CCMP3155]|eukprot:CEM39274.1 unnamed protein product [Vitrella brassicaformis CCMP3155]
MEVINTLSVVEGGSPEGSLVRRWLFVAILCDVCGCVAVGVWLPEPWPKTADSTAQQRHRRRQTGRRGRCAARRGAVPPQADEQKSARAIAQLKRDLQGAIEEKDRLELGIAALRTNCDKMTASLRPLEPVARRAAPGGGQRRLGAVNDPKAVHEFKRQIKERQQQLLALFAVASMLHALVAIKWGSLRYFDKPPTLVCSPCKHPSLCAACYEGLLRCHEAAKREKQRLERAHRRLPDAVRRDAVLRYPYCRATAESPHNDLNAAGGRRAGVVQSWF